MNDQKGNGGTLRRTEGRGQLYDNIVDTVGDTPCVRINRLAPAGVTIYVKCEFFNPAGWSRTASRSTSSRRPNATAR